MERACQRQPQVSDVLICRMIALVPTPSTLSKPIAARQTGIWAALRLPAVASSRFRSERVIEIDIPVRMHQIRTQTEPSESQ